MGYDARQGIIKEIEGLRQSKVITYLTSTRPNAGAQMGDDAARVFFDHLLSLPQRPIPKLDIFLCSNGGNGVLPWRLISLFREFAEIVCVLLPYRAYSAATMLALGADEIVMHPFAEMGPIDPTVSNDYNPIDQQTQQRLGISVEDVKAYVAFIKETVGIRHEDELIKAIEILANKVHPLALGNVERFIAQSRMIARKILKTHMSDEANKHKIDEIIDTLASKLYFHGHPINRREARDELGLKVQESLQPALEAAMWKLYLDYEIDLKNNIIYDPMSEIWKGAQPVDGGVMQVPPGFSSEEQLTLAIIESLSFSDAFVARRRYTVVGYDERAAPLVRAEVLNQGWGRRQWDEPTLV
jgi:hypothetical protein